MQTNNSERRHFLLLQASPIRTTADFTSSSSIGQDLKVQIETHFCLHSPTPSGISVASETSPIILTL